MKKFMAIFIAALLTAAMGACRQRGLSGGDDSAASPPSSQSEVTAASEPQSESEPEPPAIVEDDALYEDILLKYGGNLDEAGTIHTAAVSLYYMGDWHSASEIPVSGYYSWWLSMMWKQELSIEETEKRYSSPQGEGMGWFFPQDEFEALVCEYFDVSIEYLRADTSVYNAEHKGYTIGGGGGLGERPPIILEKIEKDGDLRRLHIRLDYEFDTNRSRVLTIKLKPEGGYYFESWVSGATDALFANTKGDILDFDRDRDKLAGTISADTRRFGTAAELKAWHIAIDGASDKTIEKIEIADHSLNAKILTPNAVEAIMQRLKTELPSVYEQPENPATGGLTQMMAYDNGGKLLWCVGDYGNWFTVELNGSDSIWIFNGSNIGLYELISKISQ